MKFKYLSLILIFFFSLTFVSGQTINLGDYATPVKQNSCYNIPFGCNNCTWANLTVTYPNGSIILSNGKMTSEDGFHYNYSFCNTDILGKYWVTYHYDEDGIYIYTDMNWFEVTPNGFSNQLGFYILIIVLSLGLVVVGYYVQDATIVVFGSFGMIFVGLYLLSNGISGIKDTVYTWGISIIILGLAFYLLVRAPQEFMD